MSWSVIGIAWVVVACASTLLTYAGLTIGGHHDLAWWPRFVARDLLTWAFWAALTPAILWLARRFPIIGPRWRRTIGVHIVVGLVLTCVFNIIRLVDNVVIGWMTAASVVPFIVSAADRTIFQFFVYLSVLAVGSAVDTERRTARLESHLLTAKLAALRAQLQPHFLFNTLHTVALLIRERENEDALRVVLDLSELLRRVVDDTDTEEIALRRELAFLERYVAIERVRFDDIDISIDADAAALDAAVPPLLLQPIVENALRHGIASGADGGSVTVSAHRSNGTVTIDVVDDGCGYDPARAGTTGGVGLRNMAARLAGLYPGTHRFEIAPLAGHGTRVRLVIPYRSLR